jgi:GH3 auxin-responsive promoter
MIQPLIHIFSQLLSPQAKNFQQQLENPQVIQASLKQELFDKFSNTEYGKSCKINSIADWHQIPIIEYPALEKWIEKQKTSQTAIITPEPILFYEKTSGSSGVAKWIPYTRSLRQSFSKMFCIWAHDLILNGPKFTTGKLYFCISPQLGESTIETNIPVSLADDSDYLDGWLKWFLRPFLVSPPGLKQIRDPQLFKHQLSQVLLLEENLEIISIWSPSFLQVILNYIQTHRLQLYDQLKNQLSEKRSKLLLESEIPWTEVWQKLKLISCWEGVNAADGAAFLRSQFPTAMVQGKGLLATEAPMTIPLIDAQGYVPLLEEVLFEFADKDGKIYQLHEIETGSSYEIILSQKAGLYRYRIGDRIRVTHFYKNTPCLEFLGRSHNTSDLVGEKLHADFVRETLERLMLTASYKSLIPVTSRESHYILLLDREAGNEEVVALRLEKELMRSHHYQQARLLGQLSPAKVIISPHICEIVNRYNIDSGKKWGDIKHPILLTKPVDQKFLELVIGNR